MRIIMKEILLYFFAGAGVMAMASLIITVILGVFLAWIAQGEPDVNGDPERDSTTVE